MKKILVTVLQVAVTIFALYYVFRKPETRADIAHALKEASIPWLLAALGAAAVAPITATVRWYLLLRVQDPSARLWRVAQLFMVGCFFNLFLLGSTGGDAVKAFYLLRGSAKERRAGIILSVLMDRLLGLLALIIMATVLLSLRYRWLTQTRETANLVNGFAVILFLSGGAIAAAFVAVQLRLAERLPENLPGRTKFIEVASAVQVYAREWPTTLLGIIISFIGHSSVFFTFYFASVALKTYVRFYDIAVLVPIVNTIVALPISVSGAGVRETLFITLLGKLCGVARGQAASVSLIGFFCTVIFYGLAGGLFYLFFRSGEGPVPAHVEEIEAREEAAALPEMIEQSKRPAV